MAIPTYVSNGLITGGSNVTSVAIAYPASPQADDIALLLVHGDFSGTINTPAGWTRIGAQTASLSVDGCVYWKRLVGGETGTVTVTRTGTAASAWFGGTMSLYRGCLASGTPYEAAGSNIGSTTSQAGVAITTTGPDRLAIHLWCFGDNLTSAPAAGWTENWEQLSALGNAGAQFADSRTAAAAGTIAAPTRTISVGNPWVVFGFALLPASSEEAHASGANTTVAASSTARGVGGEQGGTNATVAATSTARAAGGEVSGASLTSTGASAANATTAHTGGANATLTGTFFARGLAEEVSFEAHASGASVTLAGNFVAAQGAGGEVGTGSAGQTGTSSGRGTAGRFAGAALTLTGSFAACGAGGDQAGGTMNFNAVTMVWSGVDMVWNGADAVVASGANVQLGAGSFVARGAGGEQGRASPAIAAVAGAAGIAGRQSGANTAIAGGATADGRGAARSGTSVTLVGTFFAKGFAEEPGFESHVSGANATISASFAARAVGGEQAGGSLTSTGTAAARGAGGEQAGAVLDQSASASAAATAGRRGDASPAISTSATADSRNAAQSGTSVTLASAFFAAGAANVGFTQASGANVVLGGTFVAVAAGNRVATGGSLSVQGTFFADSRKESSPSGVVVNLGPGSFAAAGNTAHAGTAAPQLVDSEAANATTAHTAGANATLTGTFFARAQTPPGLGASGTDVYLEASFSAAGAAGPKSSGASLTTGSSFAAAASKAGSGGASLQQDDNEAAHASGARAAGASATIPASSNATGIQILGSGATATIAANFSTSGAAGHGGGAVQQDFVLNLAATLGTKAGGGGSFVLLVVGGPNAGATPAHRGDGSGGQEGVASANAAIGARGGASVTITPTSGANVGDLIRPWVQIILVDAMLLPTANANGVVRPGFTQEALVTAVERIG